MENVVPKKKTLFIKVQSYYDRDVPDAISTETDDFRGPPKKKEPIKIQVSRERVGITAPPPPPMPPDEQVRVANFMLDRRDPPPCPTPDYDTSSMASGTSIVVNTTPYQHKTTTFKPSVHYDSKDAQQKEMTIVKTSTNSSQMSKSKKMALEGDRVEMISIESFAMNNPSSPRPKPPATYFGTMNGAKKPKPVAVTIGEYSDRKQPSRLHFLPASSNTGDKSTPHQNGDPQIGHLLQSELAQTLSRSNLKNQTEIKGNNYLSGTTIITVNSETNPTDISTPRSVYSLYGNGLENGPSKALQEVTGQLNGILKNVNSNTSVTNVMNNGKCKNGLQTKSISFGEM